jgi:hypothetical protein
MAIAVHIALVEEQSLAADFNGSAVDFGKVFGFNAQAVWTGDAVGSIKFQTSNDTVKRPSQVTNWDDLPGIMTISGGPASRSSEYITSNAKWVRAIYERTSGTGTITINLHGKG